MSTEMVQSEPSENRSQERGTGVLPCPHQRSSSSTAQALTVQESVNHEDGCTRHQNMQMFGVFLCSF